MLLFWEEYPYHGSASRVRLGLAEVYNYGATTVYADCCTISEARIGPDSGVFGASTVTLMNLTYTYDDSGSVLSINNGTYTETYTYDLIDRLNKTIGPWGTITYKFNEVGNRLQKTKGSTISYTYNSMNQLTRVGASDDYTWDSNGNLKTREVGATTWAYVYDASNRLTVVKLNGTVHNKYYYDADGRRVRLWDSQTGTLTHVYSGLSVIYESSPVTKHIYAAGMHIAENRAGTIEYYHQDHLGSTRLKTNSTGGKVFNDNYKPYGIDYQQSGSEEFKYTGKHVDSSGLYYFGARYYEQETGRFITVDIILGNLEDPQSLNRYVYCRNNPQKYTDPAGLWGLEVGGRLRAGLPFPFNLFFGEGIEVGIAHTSDEKEGSQWGWYWRDIKTTYYGTGGVSANFVVRFNPTATDLNDLAGSSVSTEFEVADIYAGSIGYDFETNDGRVDPWFSFTISGGLGASASVVVSHENTYVYPFPSGEGTSPLNPSQPDRDRWWEESSPMDSWWIEPSPPIVWRLDGGK